MSRTRILLVSSVYLYRINHPYHINTNIIGISARNVFIVFASPYICSSSTKVVFFLKIIYRIIYDNSSSGYLTNSLFNVCFQLFGMRSNQNNSHIALQSIKVTPGIKIHREGYMVIMRTNILHSNTLSFFHR